MDESRQTDKSIKAAHGSRTRQGEAVRKEATEPEGRALLLARISTLVNASADLPAVCEAVMDEAASWCAADAAAVFVGSPRNFKCAASLGLSQSLIDNIEEVTRTESSYRFLASVTQPVLIADLGRHNVSSVYINLLASEGLCAVAAFPLVNHDRLLGFLALFCEEAREFSDDDRYMLQTFANLLTLAVANVQFTETKQGEEQARDRFLSALSHELRTPLTSIMGFTQVMRKRMANAPTTDARLSEQLDVLWTQAQRLNRLIDTFVDLSNIERGEFEINLGKVDLAQVLHAAVKQAISQAHTKQQVDTDISDPSILVHADGRRLEQVFTHMVSNALRYSPPDKPVLVRCRLERMNGRVIVEVSDRGPGIPQHMRKSIFERQNPGEAQRSGGLGVGLYLSKTIVEAHGGHVSLQSSPVEGTTITVVLPV